MSAGAAFAAVLGLSSGPSPSAQPTAQTDDFAHAPAVQWVRDLPGPLVQAAKHVELRSPVISGHQIFLGASGKNALFVLGRSTGTLVGTFEAEGAVQSAPVVLEKHIVFTDTAGYTHCYDRTTKKRVWKHYGGAPILSSPVVDDHVVFVANVGNAAYALNLSDGSLVWRHVQERDASRAVRLELYGSPRPVLSGDLVLFGFHSGMLVGLSRDLGERQWQHAVGEGRYPDVIGTPILVGQDVIVSGFTTPLVSLKLDSRNLRWRIETGGATDAVVDGERIFYGSGDGKLRSIDLLTGNANWTWDAPSESALTTPVLTTAGLFVGTADGGLFLIDEDSGDESWSLMAGRKMSGFSADFAVDGQQMVVVTNAGKIMSLVSVEDGPGFSKGVAELPKSLLK